MIPTVEELFKWHGMERDLNRMAKQLKCGVFEVADRVEGLITQISKLENEAAMFRGRITKGGSNV